MPLAEGLGVPISHPQDSAKAAPAVQDSVLEFASAHEQDTITPFPGVCPMFTFLPDALLTQMSDPLHVPHVTAETMTTLSGHHSPPCTARAPVSTPASTPAWYVCCILCWVELWKPQPWLSLWPKPSAALSMATNTRDECSSARFLC